MKSMFRYFDHNLSSLFIMKIVHAIEFTNDCRKIMHTKPVHAKICGRSIKPENYVKKGSRVGRLVLAQFKFSASFSRQARRALRLADCPTYSS